MKTTARSAQPLPALLATLILLTASTAVAVGPGAPDAVPLPPAGAEPSSSPPPASTVIVEPAPVQPSPALASPAPVREAT
ncbi:MAG TPA: 2-oxoglutarate dehydrogenase, E2 component, dihydrolipoamide succinyltransferase, partial [Polyangia bacterium]|nr:2-oxoglutarate dehydrogenase, E2 component, dihydrolipoamide succinyltransferase [Polyangia bacterium]